MKILHVAATPDGASWMTAMAREQKLLGHDVSVLLPSLDGSTAAELETFGIPAYASRVDLLSCNLRQRAVGLFQFVRLLRRLRPDVVHSHIFGSVISARIASWIADVPAHFAGNAHPLSLESEVMRLLDIGTAFCDTRTIASATYTRDLYLHYGVPAEQLALVYYAIDQGRHDPALADGARVRRELGLAHDTPVVGKMAYFYPPPRRTSGLVPELLADRGIKGHDVLLRAIPLVLAQIPEARFVLPGKGWGPDGQKYQRFLQDLADSLGIGHAVLFPGERSDVPDVLAAFDVSVHCSLSDNLGGTVESLLMERPMVVSSAPGFADTIRHEETGLVVPIDDPPALATAIVRLFRDPQLARRLGRAGRDRMLGGFTLQHTVAGIEELLSAVKVRAAHRYRLTATLVRLARAPLVALPLYLRLRQLMRRPSSDGSGGIRA